MMNVKLGKKNNEVIVNEDKFEKFVEVMETAGEQFKSELRIADYEASKRHIDELYKLLKTVSDPERNAMLRKYIGNLADAFYKKYPNGTLGGYCPDGLAGVLEEGSEYAEKNGFYYTPSGREEFSWKDNFVDVGCIVDIDIVNKLWILCSKIILNRKAMFVPEISECVGLLKKLTTAESISKGVKVKVIKYAKQFEEYFNDNDFLDYFRTHDDIEFVSEKTELQYLRTYKQLYRDLGLDFTKTETWDNLITVELLDMFEEDEEVVGWRKDYFEYGDSDNYDDEYDWEGVDEEEYVEEEVED